MQKCITWTHILIFSHTPNLPPPPPPLHGKHAPPTYSFPHFAKMHNPTTHREFYCRVRCMYPTESKFIVNTTHRRTNSLVLNSKSDPVAVSYTLTYPTILLQIDLASNANTPPPFKYSVVSGEFGTLWTQTLFLYFGERRTKIYTLSTWQLNHNIYLENYGSFSKLCSFKKCHRKPDA